MDWGGIYYFGCQRRPAKFSTSARDDKSAAAGGIDHGREFRHRRLGLAAADQLGPLAQIPHRAGARADEDSTASAPCWCMYDENVRYITGTLTPGWNRLKPGLRYAMLCGDGAPVLFEQGDLGFQIERHSPWIPKENVRHSFAWIKGAAGPASTQQVNKFTQCDAGGDEAARRRRPEARRRLHRHQHDQRSSRRRRSTGSTA